MKKTVTAKVAAMLLAALMSGCAAGPDFVRPAAPVAQRYTAQPLASETGATPVAGGAAQRFAEGQEVPERWWTAFGSDDLNRLVDAALAANPDIEAAEAALRAARENASAQRGAYFPGADLRLTPTRQRIADSLSSPTASGANLYTLHTAQLSVGYAPDAFGGVRRQVEAADAQTDVARFQREAARSTLIANLVAAVIGEAALRAQLDATRDLVDMARAQLDAVRKQQHAGQLGAADVAAQEALVAQVEGGLPPLEKQVAQQGDLLALLAGRLPSEGVAQRVAFDSLALTETLPLSLPARLVERRPDIRAAEAQLHAASAQIGIAQAARLPNIALTATLGSTALDAGTLFKAGGGFWSIGADLLQPVFRGGTLMHQQRAAVATYEQSAAQYRSVVLVAFQNVAGALHAIEADAKTLQAASATERAARKSLTIAQRQWQLGAVAYPAVLQAQQAYQQAAIALIPARAARYTDTVALFQALGG
ncbi:efflux transporter outer membrane subunit [Oxalobacteraceae bacterium OTU3CAMAD1]|nr:efflux transporter outer membrane subunit [Oxalobacteraceae bacterium OTU3CAMAD1]